MKQRLPTILANFFLALLLVAFVYTNLKGFGETGKISTLLAAISEIIVAILFLIRKDASRLSKEPIEWAIAIAGTYLATLFRPTSSPISFLGEGLVLLGSLLQILSYLSINRSFGLVPAARELKFRGMYSLVRHPIYASYLVLYFGYTLANISFQNIFIFLVFSAFCITRLRLEENLLEKDRSYQSYQVKVPWKLFPLIY